MTLADLKAAYDFVLIDLNDLETKAKSEKIDPEKIPAYKEVKDIENILYHELLNRTRDIPGYSNKMG